MIAASGLLVVIAFVTLIVGIFQPGLKMIGISIGASVFAAISLLVGVVKSRPKTVAVAGPDPLGATSWATTAAPVLDRPAEGIDEPEEEAEPTTQILRLDEPEEAPPSPRVTRPRPSTPRASSAPRKTVASRSPSTPRKTAASSVKVMVVRDKFHKESCRYAKASEGELMTVTAAKRTGAKACGVCKP